VSILYPMVVSTFVHPQNEVVILPDCKGIHSSWRKRLAIFLTEREQNKLRNSTPDGEGKERVLSSTLSPSEIERVMGRLQSQGFLCLLWRAVSTAGVACRNYYYACHRFPSSLS